jgi:hypothetical protein
LSSMLSKTVPLPSTAGNSGLPGRGMVATTLRVAASMTETSLLRPLKAQTVWVAGSKTMPSGFCTGGDGGDGGQGGAVEDDYGVAAAVGDVAEFAGGVEGDAVGAVEAGDRADGFAGLGIEDIDAGAVGEVEAVRWRVDVQVVPAAVAADLPAVEDFVGLLQPRGRRPVRGGPGLGGELGWEGD